MATYNFNKNLLKIQNYSAEECRDAVNAYNQALDSYKSSIKSNRDEMLKKVLTVDKQILDQGKMESGIDKEVNCPGFNFNKKVHVCLPLLKSQTEGKKWNNSFK